jgi:hypothetical protein
MTTHKGNNFGFDGGRRLHRIRWPATSWQFVEKFNVIVGILGFVFVIFAVREDDPFKTKALLVTLLVFFVLLAVFTIIQVWMNGEKARYAEIIETLHQCLHTVRDLDVYLNMQILSTSVDSMKTVQSRFQDDLRVILDRLVTAMSLVSSVKVNAYITQTIPENNQLRVEVLSRDSASNNQLNHMDNPNLDHWVNENTALRKIAVNEEVNYYHSSNITSDFESSFFKRFPNDQKYKSCLVLPIRGRASNKLDHQYCGFLHLESMSRKAFAPRYDVDVGATIADALFLVLSRYATLSRQRITNDEEST